MSFKEQAIEVESLATEVLIAELNDRGELPEIALRDISDDELLEELENRGVEKSIDDYSDFEIEEEFMSRRKVVPIFTIIEIVNRINDRESVGLDIKEDLDDLMKAIKSM